MSPARGLRGIALLLLAGVAGFLLTACAGGASSSIVPPDQQAPWTTVEVAVDVHGNARVSVLASGLHPDSVRALTADVAASVFPAAPAGEARILPLPVSSAASMTLQGVIHVLGAVVPGTSPSFAVDGAALGQRLQREGVAAPRLSLCLPSVPVTLTVDPPTPMVTVGGCRVWLPDRAATLPSVAVSLRPEAWRWPAGVLGAFLALGLGVTGLVRRSRAAAVASLAVLMATVILGLGGTDDAQMAGLLGGGSILGVGGLAALVTGSAAALADAFALGRRRPSPEPSAPGSARPAVPVH